MYENIEKNIPSSLLSFDFYLQTNNVFKTMPKQQRTRCVESNSDTHLPQRESKRSGADRKEG